MADPKVINYHNGEKLYKKEKFYTQPKRTTLIFLFYNINVRI